MLYPLKLFAKLCVPITFNIIISVFLYTLRVLCNSYSKATFTLASLVARHIAAGDSQTLEPLRRVIKWLGYFHCGRTVALPVSVWDILCVWDTDVTHIHGRKFTRV